MNKYDDNNTYNRFYNYCELHDNFDYKFEVKFNTRFDNIKYNNITCLSKFIYDFKAELFCGICRHKIFECKCC